MAVEWVRHCYQSQWRLFSDSPDALTKGFYYFCEDDTPDLPFMHHFGSRDWYDKNWRTEQGLGEDLGTRHFHLDGSFDGSRPFPRYVGTGQCFSDGEPLTEAADPDTLFHGYPLQCYVPIHYPPIPPEAPIPDEYERATATDRCTISRMWARMIEWLYEGNYSAIQEVIDDFFDTSITRVIYPETTLYPSLIIIKRATYALAVLDGTRNFDQLALQAIQSISGPTDVGGLSTVPLWRDAANYIHSRLVSQGVTSTMPVFLCGHSYGAAVALILAAKYRFATPNREIRYLGFGTPKPGDERLTALVARCTGTTLRNDNDIVTILPPQLGVVAWILGIFPLLNFYPWNEWDVPPSIVTQDDDGELSTGFIGNIEVDFLVSVVTRILAVQPVTQVFPGHRITEYVRRIRLRCPDPQWPVDAEVIHDLDYPFTVIIPAGTGELGMDGVYSHEGYIGLYGAAMDAGEIGLAGDVPATGEIGLEGTQAGTSGEIGLAGDVPATGEIGLAGDQSIAGEIGLAGDVPATGEIGLAGDVPATGEIGLAGDVPATGEIGLAGDVPATGELGFEGENEVAYYPSRWTCFRTEFTVITGNADLIVGSDAGAFEATYQYQNTPADGDEIQGGFYLKAGTYDLWLYYLSGAARGIIDIDIDGVNVIAGIDMYSAIGNYHSQVSNSVTVTGDGFHTINVRVNGKNALSAGYQSLFYRIWFKQVPDVEDHS